MEFHCKAAENLDSLKSEILVVVWDAWFLGFANIGNHYFSKKNLKKYGIFNWCVKIHGQSKFLLEILVTK